MYKFLTKYDHKNVSGMTRYKKFISAVKLTFTKVQSMNLINFQICEWMVTHSASRQMCNRNMDAHFYISPN